MQTSDPGAEADQTRVAAEGEAQRRRDGHAVTVEEYGGAGHRSVES